MFTTDGRQHVGGGRAQRLLDQGEIEQLVLGQVDSFARLGGGANVKTRIGKQQRECALRLGIAVGDQYFLRQGRKGMGGVNGGKRRSADKTSEVFSGAGGSGNRLRGSLIGGFLENFAAKMVGRAGCP